MASSSQNKSSTPSNTPPKKSAPSSSSSKSTTTPPPKQASKSSGSGLINSSNIGLWLIGASVVIVALVVGFIVFNENRVKSAPVAQPDVPAEWISGRNLGSPDAPVVVRLFEDFLCPTCQSFATTVKPALVEQYVKPGTVRLEYNYFPLQQHEPGATMTALAAECAVDQGYFWPYHDKVFQMASVDQQTAVQFDDLVGYAQAMGLNTDQFRSCLSSQQHKDIIAASLSEANQLNLPGTPSIFVNGQLVSDSSLATLKTAIDAAAAAKQ